MRTRRWCRFLLKVLFGKISPPQYHLPELRGWQGRRGRPFWQDFTTPVKSATKPADKFAALSFSKNLTPVPSSGATGRAGRAEPQDTQRKHKFSLDRIYRISREVGVKYKQSSFAGKFQGCLNKIRFQVKVKINEFFNGGFQCSYQAILFGSHQHACGSS